MGQNLPGPSHDPRRDRPPRPSRDDPRNECRQLSPKRSCRQGPWSWAPTNARDNQSVILIVVPRQSNSRLTLISLALSPCRDKYPPAATAEMAILIVAVFPSRLSRYKTAVETIFVGKGRLYNRRFMQMCSHYLVDPVDCTPASGWEKGQVENQVGLVRERFFTPRLRFKNLDELNAWLLDKCIAYTKVHRHPEMTEQTVWQVFEAERSKLVPYAGRFDGFHAVPASVSKTCLVRFDNNKYSVTASAVGRPVEVHAYADRIVIRQDGRIVAEHARSFGRGDTVYDPWHYVPVLARKPGALRNGAPFKDWVLPAALERVRRKLASADDGNRQMVDILNAVLTDGLPAVEAACAEAIAHGVHSADVVLNILARQRDPAPPANILTPAALTLRHAPIADCARYDNLRRTI